MERDDSTFPDERFSRLRIPILDRYVFLELATPFFASLFVFTGILFLARSLKLLELVVNRNVSLWDIAQLFLFIIPQFFEIAIPMSLLLGVILAFGRLSADSELVVMRATGISIAHLRTPVLAFGLFAAALCLLLSVWLRPLANQLLGMKMFEMAQMKASAGIVAGVFNDFGQLTIYTETVEQDGQMKNVLIADRRTPEQQRNFLARHGQISSDEATRAITLQLFDGSIHEGAGLNYNVTYFDINSVVIEQSDLVGDADARDGKKANEMSLSELRSARFAAIQLASSETSPDLTEKALTRQARIDVEFHRRFAVPASCFVVALLGIALGIQPARGSKSWGMAVNLALGIFVITLYYFAIAFATALGEQRTMPAGPIMWFPNVLFGALGYYLYRQVESEEWAAVSQAIGDGISRLLKRLKVVDQT